MDEPRGAASKRPCPNPRFIVGPLAAELAELLAHPTGRAREPVASLQLRPPTSSYQVPVQRPVCARALSLASWHASCDGRLVV